MIQNMIKVSKKKLKKKEKENQSILIMLIIIQFPKKNINFIEKEKIEKILFN